MNHIISFLLLATIVGCQAQTSANVYVQDSVLCPSGFFSTHFVGVKLDGSTGLAYVHFIGGDYADMSYVLSFEYHDQSAAFYAEDSIPVMFSATGTYWIYLAEYGTTNNWDWIEIRVVASTFSGTISPLYGSGPSGWYQGYPPFYVPMVVGTAPVPPPSQAAPVSISKILIPILVVVIVLAIAIPAGVYMYRRHKAKKMMMMAAQGTGTDSTPETSTSTVQLNSVVV